MTDRLQHASRANAALGDRRWGLLLFLLLAILAPRPSAAQESEEYQLKGALLLKFGSFVTWPDSAVEEPTSPFHVCVLGEDPFGPALDQLASTGQLDGHPLRIKRIRDVREATSCKILFLSASLGPRIKTVLGMLGRSSVLTVGDTADFTKLGGIIRLTLVESHVRFEINVDAAERAQLQVSSKLLSLATIVHDAPRQGGTT